MRRTHAFDLETALAAWQRTLAYRAALTDDDIEELTEHVRDQVHVLMIKGFTEEDAFHIAMREMGHAHNTEDAYWNEQSGLEKIITLGPMFTHYGRLAYRNLLKQKTSSLINLFGLSAAIGVAIVVFLFVDMMYSMDDFHEHGDHLFLVENIIDRDGSQRTYGDAPTALGPVIVEDLPQVEQALRIADGGGVFRYQDKVFNEGFWYADPNLFDLLTFPLKYGNPDALADPNAIILSDHLATKYFGEANPMGKELTITFGDTLTLGFTVKGVAEPFPHNASFRFNAVMGYERQLEIGVESTLTDWEAYTRATFLYLPNPDDIDVVAQQMDKYLTLQNAASEDWPIAAFVFDNLYNLSRNSHAVRGDISGGGHPAGVIVLGVIGLFLLTLACFNYMNIAIATAARRMKEIGVRKVVGGTRKQLIIQFLTENVALTLIALLVGIALAYFFFTPAFNTMFLDDEELMLSFGQDFSLWFFLVGLLVTIGLVSGAYPALYISAFKPVSIFQGKQKLTSKSLFTSTFLTFQFVLAFITIMASFVFTKNAQYQASLDWGYDQEHVLSVYVKDGSHYEVMANRVREHPDVLAVAGSYHHISRSRGYAVLDLNGNKVESIRMNVGFDYLETMNLQLVEGRFFDEAYGSDTQTAIIVNETFAENLGWDTPVGQTIREDSVLYTVIGVVADFYYEDFFDAIEPVLLRVQESSEARYLTVRTAAGRGVAVAEFVEAEWRERYPDEPYYAHFQDTMFDGFYRENQNIARVFIFTAAMALVISCMGLFGLAAQNISRRMKEISIRKVLGASVFGVAQLVNRGFVILLVIASIIAAPLSYVMLNALLDSLFPYHAAIGATPLIVSFVVLVLTALLTISSQVNKVVHANPADVLRNE